MITALCAQGHSYGELTNYDEGPDMETLVALNLQAGRFTLEKERRQVNGLCLALSSLFKADILKKYFEDIDSALDLMTLEETSNPEVAEENKQKRRVKQSMDNLSKLSHLMGS